MRSRSSYQLSWRPRPRRGKGRWPADSAGRRPDSSQFGLDPLTEALKQMEAVRHLLRLRCSFGGALGIQAVAVAHHVFDVGVISHPGFDARCGAIRQNVDPLPTLEIDDDRSKIGTLPAAPFID